MASKREQEETILQITACYVAEVQAGKQPRLSDYLTRYPQYADEIAEFVAYYHAVEAGTPAEAAGILPDLSQVSQTALEGAWKQISPPVEVPLVGTRPAEQGTQQVSILLETAQKRQLTIPQLAAALDLSVDIVGKLPGAPLAGTRPIKAATIPQELVRCLANVLQQPLSVIQAYVEPPARQQARVAEAPAPYPPEEQPEAQSFREAIEESQELSNEQKALWRAILEREGL